MTSPSSSASPSGSHSPSRKNFLSRSATSPASPARPRPRYDNISLFALNGCVPSVAAQAAYSSIFIWFAPAAGRRQCCRTLLQRLQQPLHEKRARRDRGDERVLPAGMRPVPVDAEPIERGHAERGGEIAVAAAAGRGGFGQLEAALARELLGMMKQRRTLGRLLERRSVHAARDHELHLGIDRRQAEDFGLHFRARAFVRNAQ